MSVMCLSDGSHWPATTAEYQKKILINNYCKKIDWRGKMRTCVCIMWNVFNSCDWQLIVLSEQLIHYTCELFTCELWYVIWTGLSEQLIHYTCELWYVIWTGLFCLLCSTPKTTRRANLTHQQTLLHGSASPLSSAQSLPCQSHLVYILYCLYGFVNISTLCSHVLDAGCHNQRLFSLLLSSCHSAFINSCTL